MFSGFLVAVATLFATVGVADIAFIFAALTKDNTPAERFAIATRGVAIATVILLAFGLVGNAVLDRILAPGFIAHVEQMGQRLAWHLQQLQQKFPQLIIEQRGKGLIAGIKIAPPVRDFVARNRPHHAGHVGVYEAGRRVDPLHHDELKDIVENWAASALKTDLKDIRMMRRLASAQTRLTK